MYRILIVEDRPDFRRTLSGILTDKGHVVCCAANEAEALASIAQGSFDFALVDVRLHGEAEDDESGLSLAVALRALKPEILVILLTRYIRSNQIVRAVRYYGVLDFIDKMSPDWDEQITKAITDAQPVRVISDTRRSRLLQNLVEYFDEEDLRTLCFDMELDYDNLPAQGKAGKARELVLHLDRLKRTDEFIEWCQKTRPNVAWENAPETARSVFTMSPAVAPEQSQETQESRQVAAIARRPRLEGAAEPTRFSVSLTPTHPLIIRSHGNHVCSLRSDKTLQLDAVRYHRRVEIARRNRANWRFLISEIGNSLWNDLFAEHNEVSLAYAEARAKAEIPLLVFETSRDLLDLPLEFIRSNDPAEYVVLQHPVARFIRQATPKRAVISPRMLGETSELRVLILSSNTGDLGTASDIPGVDAEGQRLYNYLGTQSFIPVSAQFVPTDHATYDRFRGELLDGHYDIVHYAGHGWFDAESPGGSQLYFWADEKRQGGIVSVRAEELKLLLDRTGVRLMYLSCCYGAATGEQSALLDDDFLGVADAVAQAGVPSVVAYRWPVSDARAPKLALAFYKSLLEQGSPEIALWSARWELAAEDRDEPTWLSPILIHQE